MSVSLSADVLSVCPLACMRSLCFWHCRTGSLPWRVVAPASPGSCACMAPGYMGFNTLSTPSQAWLPCLHACVRKSLRCCRLKCQDKGLHVGGRMLAELRCTILGYIGVWIGLQVCALPSMCAFGCRRGLEDGVRVCVCGGGEALQGYYCTKGWIKGRDQQLWCCADPIHAQQQSRAAGVGSLAGIAHGCSLCIFQLMMPCAVADPRACGLVPGAAGLQIPQASAGTGAGHYACACMGGV